MANYLCSTRTSAHLHLDRRTKLSSVIPIVFNTYVHHSNENRRCRSRESDCKLTSTENPHYSLVSTEACRSRELPKSRSKTERNMARNEKTNYSPPRRSCWHFERTMFPRRSHDDFDRLRSTVSSSVEDALAIEQARDRRSDERNHQHCSTTSSSNNGLDCWKRIPAGNTDEVLTKEKDVDAFRGDG